MKKEIKLSVLPKAQIFLCIFMFLCCLYAPNVYAISSEPDTFMTKSYVSLPAQSMSDVTYGNGLYIAVGSYGSIIKSNNAENWENVKTSLDSNYIGVLSPANFNFRGVAFGNGIFVVTGDNGVILSSIDGVNWVQRETNVTDRIYCAEYLEFNGSSAFYATTKGQMLKSTDGISWVPVVPTGINADDLLNEITVGNGNTRLAVSGSKGDIYSTTDGVVWLKTHPTKPEGYPSSSTNMLVWMNDRYYISDPAAYIWTSTDLSSFTLVGLPFKQNSTQIGNQMFTGFYDGNKCYLFGNQTPYGYGAVYTSTNGESWTMQPFANQFVAQNSVYVNGMYFRLGNEGMLVSSNGVDWNYKWGGTFYEIIYDGTKYIATGAQGNEGAIWTSNDLISWTNVTPSAYIKTLNTIACGNGNYVAIGDLIGTTTSLATSNNGTDWTVNASIDDSSKFSDITFGNGKFVAVGNKSSNTPVIKISTDGEIWSEPVLPENIINTLFSVTYINNQFVVLGCVDNSIWTSVDGNTWVSKSNLYPNRKDIITNIIYDGSKYILVGYDNDTYEMFSRSSVDLNTWSEPTVMSGVYDYAISPNQMAKKVDNIYILVTDTDDNINYFPKVYYTNDQGGTWQDAKADGITDVFPYALMEVNNQIVVSGSSQLVMTTSTVEKADIIGISFEDANTTYDGSEKTIQITGTLPVGASVSYSNNTGTNAGEYNAIATITGGSNYKDKTLNATLKINKAVLTATVGDYSKTYGEVNPAFTIAVTGFADSETAEMALNYIAPTANATATDAGTASIVINGGDAANYTFDTSDTGILTINKKPLNATATVDSKSYDGNKTTLGTINLDAIVGSDEVTGNGIFSFEDANAGIDKTVNVTGITLGGTKAGNYTLSNSSTTTRADIEPKIITATANADDKVYDGNTTATGRITLTEVLGNDDVTASGSFAFVDETVGEGKTVNVTDIILGGSDAGNYSLGNTTATAIAKITKQVQSIAVTTLPTKTTYEYGEGLDIDAGMVTITYNDNSTSTIPLAMSMCSVAGDPAIGDRIVTVSYLGKTTSFNVIYNKAKQTTPEAPKCIVTEEGITITSPVGEEYEYSKDGGLNWQNDVSFTNLNHGIQYSITARLKETITHSESNMSQSTVITFVDITKPSITALRTIRTDNTDAMVKIVSNETGKYYYEVVATGTTEPDINTDLEGMDCIAGETTIYLTLTPGGKDIYIKVKDLAGNVSNALKIEIPAYVLTNSEKASVDLNALTWDVIRGNNKFASGVTENLNLTTTGTVYGTNISWTSTNSSVISINGIVTRPSFAQGDADLTVTASIYNGEITITKDFDIVVLKQAALENANLSGIALSSGTLSPTFSADVTSYSAIVSHGTSNIIITPTAIDASSIVKINGNEPSDQSSTVSLNKGNNIITIEVTAQDGTTKKVYTIDIYRSSGSNSSEGSNKTTQPTTPENINTGVDVLVNGKPESAGTITNTTKGAQTVTTIVVDSQKLAQKIESEGNNSLVTISVNTKSDVAIAELTGDMVENMKNNQAVLEIKIDTASYKLPAQQINIDDISAQFGNNVELKDIKLRVEISKPTEDIIKVVEDSANKGSFIIIAPPLEFRVTCEYDNKEIQISTFNSYVERTVAIPNGVDPSKITTGVIIDDDGTVRHVPTKVVMIDGKYYAIINSLTNSTYSVVWHSLEFNDVENHWAKEDINDMGSRMVISGVGNDNFEPDRDITRAEFAAIIVRALGLKPGTGENPFKDVNEIEWYSKFVQTAHEHGIISGYNNSEFGPLDKITREQAMTMIARTMNITELKSDIKTAEIETLLGEFIDSEQSAKWAMESIASCIKTGITTGKSGNTIAPKDKITRAEVAVIIRRLLQKSNLI